MDAARRAATLAARGRFIVGALRVGHRGCEARVRIEREGSCRSRVRRGVQTAPGDEPGLDASEDEASDLDPTGLTPVAGPVEAPLASEAPITARPNACPEGQVCIADQAVPQARSFALTLADDRRGAGPRRRQCQ